MLMATHWDDQVWVITLWDLEILVHVGSIRGADLDYNVTQQQTCPHVNFDRLDRISLCIYAMQSSQSPEMEDGVK